MDAVKFIKEHRRMYKVTGKYLPTLAEGIPVEDVVKEVEDGIGFQFNGNWGGEVANGRSAKVLAWMPLPEPPKMDGGAGNAGEEM